MALAAREQVQTKGLSVKNYPRNLEVTVKKLEDLYPRNFDFQCFPDMPRDIGFRWCQEVRQALNDFAAKHNFRRLGQYVYSTLRTRGQVPGMKGAWSDGKVRYLSTYVSKAARSVLAEVIIHVFDAATIFLTR